MISYGIGIGYHPSKNLTILGTAFSVEWEIL